MRPMPTLVTTGPALLFASLYVLAFLVTCAGLGRRIARWLGAGSVATFLEKATVALLLGAGALELIPFVLGATGRLSVGTLRVGLALVALAALPDAWAALRRARSELAGLDRPPTWVLVWLLALLPGLIVALFSAVTPTLEPDGLGYHLTVPKRWLLSGSLAYLPTYPYSNTPMGVEMLFMNGLAVAGDAAAKLTHFALGLVGACALFAAGVRLAGRGVAVAAVTAFLYGPFGVGPVLGWAYLEGATSAALIASGGAWLIWYQSRDPGWLRVTALLAGVGVSFKITAGLFPIALAAITLLVLTRDERTENRSPVAALATVARLLPLILLPVLPFLVRSWLTTGNPIFPMAAQWIRSRDFSSSIAGEFESYNRYLVWASAHAWPLARRKLILRITALVVLGAGVAVAVTRRSPVARWASIVITVTLLTQLFATGLYGRYWIPVLAIFELPMLALLGKVLADRRAQWAVVALSAALSLLCARRGLQSVENDVSGLVTTALGLSEQRAYLERHIPLFPIYEFANRELPAEAGVMLAEYCGGFYVDRATYCADIPQDSLRYTSTLDFQSDRERLGISHLIAPVAWGEVDSKPDMTGGNVALLVRMGEHAQVNRMLRGHAKLLLQAADQGLFALDRGVD